MAVLFCSTATIASLTLVNSTTYAEEIKTRLDRPIIIALQQATDSIIEPRQQIETLAWLSEMSNNLRKRIPNEFYRVRLLQTVLDEANLMGLDPQLVLAVIDIESNFNRYAVSSVGAQGLMQVMPFWKNELGRHTDDLFNPRINIRYGCAILKHYIKLYSPSLPRALAAYNGSLGRDKYPNKVLKRLAREWPFNPIYSMQPSSVAQSDLQNTLEVNN